ncbi:MAG: 50S ribosomal protein L11 methyltransferase [Clostridiales bacterium]|nr:50S ribosomal protein L11 methyltransferase [Clostridiales bacterium]
MRWFEIKISTSHMAVEAVANMLYQFDINGVVIEVLKTRFIKILKMEIGTISI